MHTPRVHKSAYLTARPSLPPSFSRTVNDDDKTNSNARQTVFHAHTPNTKRRSTTYTLTYTALVAAITIHITTATKRAIYLFRHTNRHTPKYMETMYTIWIYNICE